MKIGIVVSEHGLTAKFILFRPSQCAGLSGSQRLRCPVDECSDGDGMVRCCKVAPDQWDWSWRWRGGNRPWKVYDEGLDLILLPDTHRRRPKWMSDVVRAAWPDEPRCVNGNHQPGPAWLSLITVKQFRDISVNRNTVLSKQWRGSFYYDLSLMLMFTYASITYVSAYQLPIQLVNSLPWMRACSQGDHLAEVAGAW